MDDSFYVPPRFSMASSEKPEPEKPESDAEREVREAHEEAEEDRWVNVIITDLLDEYLGLDEPSWGEDKHGKKRADYRDKLCFLYSVSGGRI